jgi:hypothetical protein
VMHLEKKHWIWIGVAAAGVAGLYLLSHRGSSGGSASDAGLPATGPPQLGNMTPSASQGSYYDQGEQVAAFTSLSDRHRQLAQANAAQTIPLTGTVSKAWAQLATGDWQDRFHPGHIISEQEAEAIGPSNHGPYAKGGGTFIDKFFRVVGNNIKQAVQVYAASQGVPVALPQSSPRPVQPTPRFGTPGIAPSPSPALSYGNPPVYEIGG